MVVIEFSNNDSQGRKRHNKGVSIGNNDRDNLLTQPSRQGISVVEIPCFQDLCRVCGDLDEIGAQIEELKAGDSSAWLEVEYTGTKVIPHLSQIIEEAVSDTSLEVRRIRNRQIALEILQKSGSGETLDELTETDVFQRCLLAASVDSDDRDILTDAFNEIVAVVKEKDVRES